MTAEKHPVTRALALFGLVAFLSFGPACGWRSTPLFSVGPYDLPPEEVLSRVDATLREHGYQATIDREHGVVAVQASYAHRGAPSTFTIQCYRNGWLAVRMTGGYVRLDGDQASVPKALRAEYRTFVMMIRDSVGAPTVEG